MVCHFSFTLSALSPATSSPFASACTVIIMCCVWKMLHSFGMETKPLANRTHCCRSGRVVFSVANQKMEIVVDKMFPFLQIPFDS